MTNGKRPIVRSEDLQGLKIRTMQNAVSIDASESLGADAVPMPWPEIHAVLEQRATDAQEDPFAITRANEPNEVRKYPSVTEHGASPTSRWSAASCGTG